MSEQLPPHNDSPDDYDQEFAAMTATLGPMSILDQKELLAEIRARHQQALSAAEIIKRVVDILPLSRIGGAIPVEVRRAIKGDVRNIFSEVECVYVYATTSFGDVKHPSPLQLYIAERRAGVVKPVNGFDETQATLAFALLDELAYLKANGALWDLSNDFGVIFDIKEAMERSRAARAKLDETDK